MRERLIKLLKSRSCPTCIFNDVEIKGLAAHLLANGVILPSVKVGDTVYLIPTYNGKPYCGVVADKVQMIGITSRGIHIKAREHHDHNKMYMLGKKAFLTREEAEKALAERMKDNG